VGAALARGGVVIVNGFGLPAHLRPWEGSTPQVRLAQAMQGALGYLYAMPYRRNATLIGSRDRVPEVHPRPPARELRGIDRVISELWLRRWRLAERIGPLEPPPRCVTGARSEIDAEMQRRWPRLIEALNDALEGCGYWALGAGELGALVRDPVRAPAVTEWLVERGAPEASFIPIAVASAAFGDSHGLDWYPHWIFERAEKLIALSEAWFVNVALWQLLALAACPFARAGRLADEIGQLVQRLGLPARV
jgi:hypothetical protein